MKSKDWLVEIETHLRSKGYTGEYNILLMPDEGNFINITLEVYDSEGGFVRSYNAKSDSYFMAACAVANKYFSDPMQS